MPEQMLLSKRQAAQALSTSVITLKAANGYQFKPGQRK
jgi:hypothetical protein